MTALLSEHAHQLATSLVKSEVGKQDLWSLHFTALSCLSCSEMLQRMANELPSPSFRITLYCPVEDSGPKSRLSAKEPRPVYYTFSEEGRVVE